MKAYTAGDLGGLCGIYAVINATRIVSGRSDITTSEILFSSIMDSIGDAHLIAEGLGIHAICRILREVVGDQIPHRRMPFRTNRRASVQDIWGTLQPFLQEEHRSAIIWVGWTSKPHSSGHWTTVLHATSKQLLLVDSSGYQALNRANCTIDLRDQNYPHVLYGPCIILCSRTPISI